MKTLSIKDINIETFSSNIIKALDKDWKKLDILGTPRSRVTYKDSEIKLLLKYILFFYTNFICSDFIFCGFDTEIIDKDDTSKPLEITGLLTDNFLHYFIILLNTIKKDDTELNIQEEYMLFLLLIYFMTTKDYNKTTAYDIIEKIYLIPCKTDSSRSSSNLSGDNIELGLKGFIDNDVFGKSRAVYNGLLSRFFSTSPDPKTSRNLLNNETTVKLMNLIISEPDNLHIPIGVILFLTNACCINYGSFKLDLSVENFNTALGWIMKGYLPFVYNFNREPLLSTERPEKKWYNLYHSDMDIDMILNDYILIQTAKVRLLSRKLKISNSSDNFPSTIDLLGEFSSDSIFKTRTDLHTDKSHWINNGKFSCVTGKKMKMKKKSHCRLCGGIFLKETEQITFDETCRSTSIIGRKGRKYLTSDGILEVFDKELLKNLCDRYKLIIDEVEKVREKKKTGIPICRICGNQLERDLIEELSDRLLETSPTVAIAGSVTNIESGGAGESKSY